MKNQEKNWWREVGKPFTEKLTKLGYTFLAGAGVSSLLILIDKGLVIIPATLLFFALYFFTLVRILTKLLAKRIKWAREAVDFYSPWLGNSSSSPSFWNTSRARRTFFLFQFANLSLIPIL